MLNEEMINERKNSLLNDLNTIQSKMVELEKKKLETIALSNALTGAVQQCDDFLNKINNDETEDLVSSDVG
tara:strand:+ start:129 stop:341 length:213 start_codon:yes stop_codon:yes gene_type:complete